MELDADQVASKRVIGKSGARRLIEIKTRGGWNLIVRCDASGFTPVGCGSHPAIAKFIAKKKDPEIEYDELSKSEELDFALIEQFVPFWENFTNQLIAANKK